METTFVYTEAGKIISRPRPIHSPAFSDFARSIKRKDHLSADNPQHPTGSSKKTLYEEVYRAPFAVSKYKGQYKFRFGVEKEPQVTREGQFQSADHKTPEAIREYARSCGYVELDEPNASGERLFVKFQSNKDKGDWVHLFTEDEIYVSKPKAKPGEKHG
jgi:hypothetical protein